MIVCICRNIDDKDYVPEELKKRILQDDFQCGQCQLYYFLKLDERKSNESGCEQQ